MRRGIIALAVWTVLDLAAGLAILHYAIAPELRTLTAACGRLAHALS